MKQNKANIINFLVCSYKYIWSMKTPQSICININIYKIKIKLLEINILIKEKFVKFRFLFLKNIYNIKTLSLNIINAILA